MTILQSKTVNNYKIYIGDFIMDFSDLNDNQKRIFSALKSKGYVISPEAIVTNGFEEIWEAEGVVTTTTTTTPTPTTTTPTPTTTTPTPTTTTPAPVMVSALNVGTCGVSAAEGNYSLSGVYYTQDEGLYTIVNSNDSFWIVRDDQEQNIYRSIGWDINPSTETFTSYSSAYDPVPVVTEI